MEFIFFESFGKIHRTAVSPKDFKDVMKLGNLRMRRGYVVYEPKTLSVARFIAGATPGQEVDHKDGNPMNNTRSNLRLSTRSQNLANRRGWGKSSKYKGVYPAVTKRRWFAQCSHTHCGSFSTQKEAAEAYDKAAKKKYGKFAKTNF